MTRRFPSRLIADESGTAAVEFSLWSVLFFLVAMAGLDFGAYYLERGAVDEGVSAAAVSSFSQRSNVNFTDIPAYVRTLSDNQALTVSTSCNGVAGSCTNVSTRSCACLNAAGAYVATACGSTCAGTGMPVGSTAGYYLTIDASKPYQPMLLPDGLLTPSQIRLNATVRLQ